MHDFNAILAQTILPIKFSSKMTSFRDVRNFVDIFQYQGVQNVDILEMSFVGISM